jgi:hypothetical protein
MSVRFAPGHREGSSYVGLANISPPGRFVEQDFRHHCYFRSLHWQEVQQILGPIALPFQGQLSF